jgi:hypothetical protein
MLKIETVRYEMFVRVREFGKAHQDLFTNSSKATQAFAQVAEAAATIEAHAIAKPVAADTGRTAKAAARAALRKAMVPIAHTARGLNTLTATERDNLRLPRRKNTVEFVAAARKFAAFGEKARDELIAFGLDPSALEDLREATERFDQAVTTRAKSRQEVATSQGAIATAIKSGLQAARQLDIIVPNLLRRHPDLLAGWRNGRRIVIARRTKTRGTDPATAAVTPAATRVQGEAVANPAEPLPKAS